MKKENNNTLPITDLVKDTMNFNKHKRMDLLNKSLEKFGAGRSILIDKNNHIIAGNGLVETAEKLDYKDIVVVESDGTKIIAVKRTDIDLNTKVGRELALADNQTAHLNLEWDYENLNMAVEDFAIDLNEFEIPVEEVAEELQQTEGDDDVPTDSKNIFVVRGDIFELKANGVTIRVGCLDSCNSDDVALLMNGERADMVCSDPPYNIASETSGIASNSDNKQMKILMDSDWDKNFKISDIFPIIELFAKENRTIYIFTSHHLFGDVIENLKNISDFTSFCVWNKPNPMPSLSKRHWTWNTELICYSTKGTHIFNFPQEGHALSVWTFTKVSKCDLHPTMKTVSIMEHPILHSSKENQNILDLFCGSGTTAVACLKTKRNCFTNDISENYVQVSIKRLIDFCDKNSMKYTITLNGKLFDVNLLA